MFPDLDSTTFPRDDDKRPSDQGSLVYSRQDPFDTLATEIISEIFSYAYPVVYLPAEVLDWENISDISNPAILSMVCKRWQAILMADHSLWATITIEAEQITQEDWADWGFLQLRTHLERSGSCPLDIRIENDIESGIKDEVIYAILNIVMPHSKRWRSIAFAFALGLECVQKFNILNGCLPLLENFEINLCEIIFNDNDKSTCPAFLSASKLNSLCINPSSGMDILRRIQIPWTQITELTIGDSEFHDQEIFCKILEWLSVSLMSLTIPEAFDIDHWPATYSREVTLPQLRQLYLLAPDCYTLLDILICPSLQVLEITHLWRMLDIAYSIEETMTTFLDSSSCILTHMKLCDLSRSPTYHTVLRRSSLSTLKFISLADIMDPILDLLNFDSHQLFPSLETLHLYLCFEKKRNGQQCMQSQIEEIRKVVDSRSRTLTSNGIQRGSMSYLRECLFNFELAMDGPNMDGYWDEESIQALQSMCISRHILVSLTISHSRIW